MATSFQKEQSIGEFLTSPFTVLAGIILSITIGLHNKLFASMVAPLGHLSFRPSNDCSSAYCWLALILPFGVYFLI